MPNQLKAIACIKYTFTPCVFSKSCTITTRQQTTMTNLKRMKWIKGKGHKSLFCQTQKTTLVRLIRYANNFVIIINDERLVEQYFKEAKSFLAEHGLQLSSEKTHIFPWKIRERLHFIGFIFHKIDRACFHSRITTQWKAGKSMYLERT